MGFIREPHGDVTIEERMESFVVHPRYGYDETGTGHSDLVRVDGHMVERRAFAERWRAGGHPEFTYDSLPDLRAALTALAHSRPETRARRNADAADDGTPLGRLYSRLLHVQLDLQDADDEDAETLLCDLLDSFSACRRRAQEDVRG